MGYADGSDGANLTSPGSTVGTAAYMSPRAGAAARPWMLAPTCSHFWCRALEMAPDDSLFSGATSAVIFNQILEHTPTPRAL